MRDCVSVDLLGILLFESNLNGISIELIYTFCINLLFHMIASFILNN